MPRSTTRYVAGFMFDETLHSQVALIRKNRPPHFANKLNGIGGHVEEGEVEIAAMVREFREETGYETTAADWKSAVVLTGPGYSVEYFVAWGDLLKLETRTDESVELWNSYYLAELSIVEDVEWLLPMCRSILLNKRVTLPVHVQRAA